MADYGRVARRFWTDPRVRGWDTDTKALALYLLTGPHGTTEGYYVLSLPYVADDLGWTTKEVKTRLDKLVAAGFVAYDAEARVVLLHQALKYQAPSNANQLRGAVKALSNLPPNRLWGDFLAAAERYAKSLHTELAADVERLASGLEAARDTPPPAPTPPPTNDGEETTHDSTPAHVVVVLTELLPIDDPDLAEFAKGLNVGQARQYVDAAKANGRDPRKWLVAALRGKWNVTAMTANTLTNGARKPMPADFWEYVCPDPRCGFVGDEPDDPCPGCETEAPSWRVRPRTAVAS